MQKDSYEAAKRRALARKLFLKTDGGYLSHEEARDRGLLRRRRTLLSGRQFNGA